MMNTFLMRQYLWNQYIVSATLQLIAKA